MTKVGSDGGSQAGAVFTLYEGSDRTGTVVGRKAKPRRGRVGTRLGASLEPVSEPLRVVSLVSPASLLGTGCTRLRHMRRFTGHPDAVPTSSPIRARPGMNATDDPRRRPGRVLGFVDCGSCLPSCSCRRRPAPPVILTEGNFGPHHAQDRDGRDPLRHRPDRRRPRFADRRPQRSRVAARATTSPPWRRSTRRWPWPSRPNTLLIGIAPTGGKLPESWRRTILDAIERRARRPLGPAHVPRRRPRVRGGGGREGHRIVDYRRPPERRRRRSGGRTRPGKRVILTVGTDCAIGKMSVALELRQRRSRRATAAVFVPTGQTGMMIDGWGVAVDRVISDFVAGDRRVDARGGRGARRLAHRRGPGLARPPGVFVRDPRAHPRLDAARHGDGPQARA